MFRQETDMKPTNKRSAALLFAAAVGLAGANIILKEMRKFNLRGKVVLITGGSRGLGLELAREFARRGARLAICARDDDELDRACADLRAGGADVLGIQCDVTLQNQVDAMARGVVGHFGGIDVL